jgi:hypothetical protein
MSRTIGPVLATGALTIANQTVFNGKPMDWRVPIATGLAAIGFSPHRTSGPGTRRDPGVDNVPDRATHPDEPDGSVPPLNPPFHGGRKARQ